MNYTKMGHHHRLQIISPHGANHAPRYIDLHCHSCGLTFQVWRCEGRLCKKQYHVINTF